MVEKAGEPSRFAEQRGTLWANARRRREARAARAAAPPAPRRPSSAEVAEQRARQAEADGMPASAAAIRQAVEDLPELYPPREEQV